MVIISATDYVLCIIIKKRFIVVWILDNVRACNNNRYFTFETKIVIKYIHTDHLSM